MKICKNYGCENESIVNNNHWSGSDYCKSCASRIDLAAGAKDGNIRLNRTLGMNDDGTISANRDPIGQARWGREQQWGFQG